MPARVSCEIMHVVMYHVKYTDTASFTSNLLVVVNLNKYKNSWNPHTAFDTMLHDSSYSIGIVTVRGWLWPDKKKEFF